MTTQTPESIAKENRLNLEIMEAQREIRRLQALLDQRKTNCPECGARFDA